MLALDVNHWDVEMSNIKKKKKKIFAVLGRATAANNIRDYVVFMSIFEITVLL